MGKYKRIIRCRGGELVEVHMHKAAPRTRDQWIRYINTQYAGLNLVGARYAFYHGKVWHICRFDVPTAECTAPSREAAEMILLHKEQAHGQV